MTLETLRRRLGASLLLFLAALQPLAAQPSDGARLGGETGIGALYEVLRNDFRTAPTLERLENDREYFATNPNATSSVSESERRRIVAMARNGDIGKLLFEAALEDLRLRSRELARSLASAKRTGVTNTRAQVWDIVIVGGGIHDQIINNTLTARNPNLRVLSIETTNLVASNFALAKALGRINSSNRATISDRLPRPGVGNLNEFPLGPLQVPDVAAVKYPTFNSLSDVATVNRAVASAEMLFNDTVATVEDRELGVRGSTRWPARYRVTLQSGAVVYADAVGYSTGLGDPNGADRADNKDVYTYEGFINNAASSRTPFRQFVGKRVAVFGPGDSGKVAIEWLLRLAPDAGYAEDTAQVGQVDKIEWIGQDKDTCFKYLNGVRSRYADIASGLKTRKVQAYAGRGDFRKLADGTYEVTTAEGKKLIVDKIILATGFTSVLEKTLEPIVTKDRSGRKLGPQNPIVDSNAVEDVKGKIGTQEPGAEREAVVARKLKPVSGVAQEIYFFGAGGGSIVQRDETAGITENLKSIFALGARTAALGELLARKFAGRRGSIDAANRYVVKAAAAGEGLDKTALRLPDLSDRGVRPFVDLLLEAQLKSTLRRSFDLAPELKSLDLTFKVVEGQLVLQTSKPVLKASMDRLKAGLEANSALMSDLAALTVTGSAVKIKMVREGTGRVTTPERMRIQRLVSRDLTLDSDRIGVAGRLGIGDRVTDRTVRRGRTR